MYNKTTALLFLQVELPHPSPSSNSSKKLKQSKSPNKLYFVQSYAMHFSLALISLFATHILSSPIDDREHPALRGEVSPLYNPNARPEDLISPPNRGVTTTDDDTDTGTLEKRGSCPVYGEGRGNGVDYDYGCDKGWCWRNCNGPFLDPTKKKSWCWLAYEGGWGPWTPCGGWYDCEWSYNNVDAKCGKGDCGACGCSCT